MLARVGVPVNTTSRPLVVFKFNDRRNSGGVGVKTYHYCKRKSGIITPFLDHPLQPCCTAPNLHLKHRRTPPNSNTHQLSDLTPSPSIASLTTSPTTSPSASFAPFTSATTPSSLRNNVSISSLCLCTSSKSSAFCDCVVWRRALSCDWCAIREGVRCAERIVVGGWRWGLCEVC